jgi:hypothetical protein
LERHLSAAVLPNLLSPKQAARTEIADVVTKLIGTCPATSLSLYIVISLTFPISQLRREGYQKDGSPGSIQKRIIRVEFQGHEDVGYSI